MMCAESVNMIENITKKIYANSECFAAFGIGLTIGYLTSLAICIAHIN